LHNPLNQTPKRVIYQGEGKRETTSEKKIITDKNVANITGYIYK
jgi:hypothetical protein